MIIMWCISCVLLWNMADTAWENSRERAAYTYLGLSAACGAWVAVQMLNF